MMPAWIILNTVIRAITIILSGYVFWKLMKYVFYFLGIALDSFEDKFDIQINDRLAAYTGILLIVLAFISDDRLVVRKKGNCLKSSPTSDWCVQ